MVLQRPRVVPPALLLLCGVLAVLSYLGLRAKPSANALDDLKGFMDSSHEGLAPEETAAEVWADVKDDVVEAEKKLVESVKSLPNTISEELEDVKEGLEEFEEANHEGLVPEVTAHDIGLKVEAELEEVVENVEEGENLLEAVADAADEDDDRRRRKLRLHADTRE
jgi:hypothetical protein